MPKKIKIKKARHSDTDVLFNTALQYYQSGNLEQAEIICGEILKQRPNDPSTLNLFGLILYEDGQYEDAIYYLRKAIQIDPNGYSHYYNLGNILVDRGEMDEAIENYKKAIMLKPDYAYAYFYLGNVFLEKDMIDEAIENYKEVIKLMPNFAEAYNNLGLSFENKGMVDEAIGHYKNAISIKHDFAEAYYNLGNAFAEKGMINEAIKNYMKALEANPDYPDAYTNLGVALAKDGMVEEAIENYNKALRLNPDCATTYLNLGDAYNNKCMLDEAIENYKKALALNPNYAEAYSNLGNVFASKCMMDVAVENLEMAVKLKPEDAEMHKNLGMTYLLAKDFEHGWEEYEWRLKTFQASPLMKLKWDGGSLEDKIILIYNEQGYGDTIQFCRYLPKLYDDFGAKKVLFMPQKGLEQLLRESDLKAEILDAGTPVENLQYDTNIHLLSLPRIFKTNLENIPFKGKRYLKANPEKVAWYREKYFNSLLVIRHLSLKVGIFWQGNPLIKYDRERSIPLKNFYSLCRIPGVKVYSLQKGYGIEHLKEAPGDINIVNLGETFNDFSDTAAAIENLDLVITVDTAIGHLSGALGKKTWILLPSHAEWRWHLDMDYSPWYEDVRLFRHKEPGKKDWEEMMQRVVRQVEVEVKAE